MKTTALILSAGALLAINANALILINELRPNPPGTDPGSGELVELIATEGEASFTGFWQSIEGDSGFDVQDSGSINVTFTNGLATFDTGDIENPAFTFFISTVDYSSAAAIGDIDSANVNDAIGIPDQTSGDTLYGSTLGGQDFAYTGDEPGLIFRDGTDLAWYAINDPANGEVINIGGTDVLTSPGGSFSSDPEVSTFGSANPSFTAVPEPSTYAAFAGLMVLGLAVYRRRK